MRLQQGSSKPYLAPIIMPDIVERLKANLKQLLEEESKKPIEHAQLYDKYAFLINRQVCFG